MKELTTPREEFGAVAAIVLCAFLFGTAFVVIQHGLGHVDPIPFLAIRFGVASLLYAPFGWKRRARAVEGEWRAGVAAGLVYFVAIAAQTVALRYTTPSAAAFLTYLLVVAVPLIGWMTHRVLPSRRVLVALLVAIIGLALLTGGGIGLGRGELLAVFGAFGFGYHLVQMGMAANRYDPFRFNGIHCLAAFVPALALTPFTGGLPDDLSGWGVGIYAGVVISFFVMLPWLWAQRRIEPTRVALIYLLEPVFAALASYVDGERLTVVSLVGAALILLAAAMAETGAPAAAGQAAL